MGDNVKHRFLDETAGSCIQTAPLLLEYKPELQEDQKIMLLDEYSSSAKLGEELMYVDDIEEFMSAVIKDGNLQDQRYFMFKSASTRKRSRRRSVLQESLTVAAYYGESDETSSPEIRRRRDEEWEVSSICKKCSLARPRYFCSPEVNEAAEAEAEAEEFEKRMTQTPLPSTMRAITMPCERSNSFPYHGYSPCRHIHPKLPDYDELAAKFMELKRENLEKKSSVQI